MLSPDVIEQAYNRGLTLAEIADCGHIGRKLAGELLQQARSGRPARGGPRADVRSRRKVVALIRRGIVDVQTIARKVHRSRGFVRQVLKRWFEGEEVLPGHGSFDADR